MSNNISVKDANNNTVTVKTTDNAGVHTPSHNANIQVGGTDVGGGNPVPVSLSGGATSAKQDSQISLGTANKVAVANVAAIVSSHTPTLTNIYVATANNASKTNQLIASTIQTSAHSSNTSNILGSQTTILNTQSGYMVAIKAAVSNTATVLTSTGLPSGTNTIGKVGIDQTTPGTTNGFSEVGRSTLATNQVSVASTSTLIVASRAGRRSVTIINHGTTDVFIGVTGVTTSSGILLAGTKGTSMTLSIGAAAIYGIVATGTQTVSYLEAY